MNSNKSVVWRWTQRGIPAMLSTILVLSGSVPSMARHSSQGNAGGPVASSSITPPVSKTFRLKKLGGAVTVTRKTKAVKVALNHKQARKAKLKAYNASTKSWAPVSRGKTTRKRAVWKVAPINTRVKVRVGALKSGVLGIPGVPTAKRNPAKPNPGTADPTPKEKTPPALSPSDDWDWDEWWYIWPEFKCNYDEGRYYGNASPWMALYEVFCDPWTYTTGVASPQAIYPENMSSCLPLSAGRDGVVYEIPYTIQLRDIRTGEGEYTNFSVWGRSDIRAHDIVPRSAHLDSNGQLAYTQRTRIIPVTQDSVTIVLPFYESRAIPLEGREPYPRLLSTDVEDAYTRLSESLTKGSNMKPILSWMPVGTVLRPVTWERDVWGVPGVNGRTQGVGRSSGWNSNFEISWWSRQHNVASFNFRPISVAFTEYEPICNP